MAVACASDITVSGFSGFLGSVRVTLFDVSHNLPDNMQFLLVSPTGSSYVLAADVGGAIPVDPAAPVTLSFSDGASTILPDNGPLATGTFLPTSCGTVQTFPLPAPQVGYFTPPCQVARTVGQRMRDAFGGGLANGTWHLYVYDDNGAAAPAAPVGLIAGGWGLQPLSTTAATVSCRRRLRSRA